MTVIFKRYVLHVTYQTAGSAKRTKHIPVMVRFFGRLRARRIINRGFRYRDGKRLSWIPASRVVLVELELA